MLGKYLPFYFTDAVFILMRKEFSLTKKKKRPKNEFLKRTQHLGARDYGPHPFLLRVFHYCLLTISAHQGPWTTRERKMDTAQIDSVTSHRHVWIMRFGCSLSHSKHISVTDLSKIWLGKVSFLREGISFFFSLFLAKETNLSKLRLCNLNCGKSWNWHRADQVPLSLPKKKKKEKRGRRGGIKLEGSSEMLINFEFPKESGVFLGCLRLVSGI